MQGTVTGTLGGSVLAHVTSLTAQNDGSIELTLTHDFVTEEGALLRTEDTATLSPVQGKEGVFQQETQHTILEGTGRFANATGQLENHGEADLVKGLLTLRYSGTICGVAP